MCPVKLRRRGSSGPNETSTRDAPLFDRHFLLSTPSSSQLPPMRGQSISSISSDNNPNIIQKWDRVDLFCPHPFLRKQSLSLAKPVSGKADDLQLSGGLLSTTAFRPFGPQISPPLQNLRPFVISLLQFWQQVRPQDVPRYAVALRPILSQIFGIYLRNEFELSTDELAQIRELGWAVAEHCRTLNEGGVMSGRHNETEIGIRGRVATHHFGPRRSQI